MVENRAALREELAATFAVREAAVWRAELEAAGVPCAPIKSLDEVERDEHVGAVGGLLLDGVRECRWRHGATPST